MIGFRGGPDRCLHPSSVKAERFSKPELHQQSAELFREGKVNLSTRVYVAQFTLGNMELRSIDRRRVAQLPVCKGLHISPGLNRDRHDLRRTCERRSRAKLTFVS